MILPIFKVAIEPIFASETTSFFAICYDCWSFVAATETAANGSLTLSLIVGLSSPLHSVDFSGSIMTKPPPFPLLLPLLLT